MVTIDEQDKKRDGPVTNTPEQITAIQTVHDDWFEDDKSARLDVESEWREVDKLRRSQHWDLLDVTGNPLRTADQQSTRPNIVDNVTHALIEGQVAEFAEDVSLIDYPTEPGDEEAAQVMGDLKEFIMYKNRLEAARIEFLRDLFWYGTACWEVAWDPTWKGGRGPNRWVGDIRWRHLDIWQLFPDARARTDLHEGNRVHKAKITTLEYIRERYPDYGHLVQADANADTYHASGDIDTDSITDASTKDTSLLVETWYMGKPLILGKGEKNEGSGLHVIWWAGEGQPVYLKHANYVNYDPGEDAKFPFAVRRRYPRAKPGIWGFGEAFYLKHQNMALNKTEELELEAHMHHAVGRTYYQVGALSDPQRKDTEQYGTLPGIHLEVNDIQNIKHVPGSGAPASLQSGQELRRKSMESQIGRFDITQGRTPGSVTAFSALDLLAKKARTRLQSADVAIKTAYEDCGNLCNNLIVRNYTEQRTYRVLGRNGKEQPELRRFSADQIKRVYLEDTDQVVPYEAFSTQYTDPETGELAPPEGLAYEVYSPEFDTKAKTSMYMPSDRLVNLDMAVKLLSSQLIDTEAVFHVLEHGRFEPWEDIKARMQAQQMAQAQAQAGMPVQPGEPPAQMEGLDATAALPPELQDALAQLSPDEQAEVLAQALEAAGGGMGAPQTGTV